ncbi:SHOCT domain-containing protein [Butyrivibrio sp. CB08]|uniref:SHOCT domain-containing protein n=1 Tax=Butyrivibrio sp. CB08 TaxID=2364879 RepID=UPI0018F4AA9F|nr:SHOCT domain-containing protein [Butyrivibrio sp. CB08]
MSKQEAKRENHYQITMTIASDMLKKGLIDEEEFDRFELRMREKYKPKFSDIFWGKSA